MPIILEDNLLFIHIPKTGGTSIENFLKSNGKKISLLTSRHNLINGHSAQHITFREVQALGLDYERFNFFTIVRDPVDRTISEYFWLKKYKNKKYKTFDIFLDSFLNIKNSNEFDNHNLSSYDFLINKSNVIDSRIKIFNFFDDKNISKFLGFEGLNNFNDNKTDKEDFNPSLEQESRIKEYFKLDYKNFIFKN